jgi:hypothetical protein
MLTANHRELPNNGNEGEGARTRPMGTQPQAVSGPLRWALRTKQSAAYSMLSGVLVCCYPLTGTDCVLPCTTSVRRCEHQRSATSSDELILW